MRTETVMRILVNGCIITFLGCLFWTVKTNLPPVDVENCTQQQTAEQSIKETNNIVYAPPIKCKTVSFETLYRPCRENVSWDFIAYDKMLNSNITNSQIEIVIKPIGKLSFIKITTFNKHNKRKLIGGDFWWINVIGPSSYHVDLIDHNDGTYSSYLSFLRNGSYKVDVELIWSLCDGLRDPPKTWFIDGDDQGKYQKKGTLGEDTYIGQKREFPIEVPPHDDETPSDEIYLEMSKEYDQKCRFINSPCGIWDNGQYLTVPKHSKLNLKYNQTFKERNVTIMFYGDSQQNRFYNYFLDRKICQIMYNCNNTYLWVYPNPPSKRIYDNLDFNKTIILESIKSVLRHSHMKQKDSILLLNLGLHYNMDLSMNQSFDLIQDIINLYKLLKLEYGQDNIATLLWRSTTPPFEREWYKYNEDHRRFLTKQRALAWNAFTQELMCEERIPILDVYQVASSYPPGTKDGVHFEDSVFQSAAEAFEEYIVP